MVQQSYGRAVWYRKRMDKISISDSTENCPTGFNLYESNGIRACGRATSNVGICQSVQFPSNGVSYSQVCGRVVGYQFATPSGVDAGITDINTYYLDVLVSHMVLLVSIFGHFWLVLKNFRVVYSIVIALLEVHKLLYNPLLVLITFVSLAMQKKLAHFLPLWDGKSCNGLEVNCCSDHGLQYCYY